jgi:hypothetical protein
MIENKLYNKEKIFRNLHILKLLTLFQQRSENREGYGV